MSEQATTTYTVEDYVFGCSGYPISADVVKRILLDNGIDEGTEASDLTLKQKDYLKMSVIEAILLSPSMTQSVADADGNWSHKEGATESNAVDRAYLKKQLRDLKKKWGILTEGSVSLHNMGMMMHKQC